VVKFNFEGARKRSIVCGGAHRFKPSPERGNMHSKTGGKLISSGAKNGESGRGDLMILATLLSTQGKRRNPQISE